jgi:phosphoglycolate phosphatase
MSTDKLNKPKGVLFDLDGTLLDTAPDLGAALNHVLQSLGVPEKTYEEYRVESSNGSIGMLKMGLGDNFQEYDEETLRQQFLDHYESNISNDTVFFVGIVDLLTYLDNAQIPWGVVTNKPGYLTEKLLKDFKEFETCKVCYCGDTFEHRKPHPEPLLKAAEVINVKPQDIWYVGDAPRDMEAATAANMISVLARYGYLTEEELARQWDVDIQVDSATELLAQVDN